MSHIRGYGQRGANTTPKQNNGLQPATSKQETIQELVSSLFTFAKEKGHSNKLLGFSFSAGKAELMVNSSTYFFEDAEVVRRATKLQSLVNEEMSRKNTYRLSDCEYFFFRFCNPEHTRFVLYICDGEDAARFLLRSRLDQVNADFDFIGGIVKKN